MRDRNSRPQRMPRAFCMSRIHGRSADRPTNATFHDNLTSFAARIKRKNEERIFLEVFSYALRYRDERENFLFAAWTFLGLTTLLF